MTTATCYACQAPIVCEACESCATHCHTPGGPEACWEAIERWRRGEEKMTHGPEVERPPATRPDWSRSS